MTFAASWWQIERKDVEERQAAACVLAGELQIVHGALKSAVKSGRESPELAMGALQALRLMKLNPSPSTWGLAVKLDPPLAESISAFRGTLTMRLNMLDFPAYAPMQVLPRAQDILSEYYDMVGTSGSFENKLKIICERGGKYTPTEEEASYTMPFSIK
ncbi:MAG: hypothetical protein M0006_04885 [Magnetospirillum sp.]|nr:hypothetical protein [Magnetospirillum sp.]